jgi:hypothetical protein
MMTRSEMIYEMKLSGIAERVIEAVSLRSDRQGWKSHIADAELRRHGCETMFTNDYYDYDEWDEGTEHRKRFPERLERDD